MQWILCFAALLVSTLVFREPEDDQPGPASGPARARSALSFFDSDDPNLQGAGPQGDPASQLLLDQLQGGQRQPLNFVYELVGGPHDDGLGASLTAVDPALRAQLDLPERQGVVVGSIASGGPADQAGLKPNDILLSLDRDPIGKAEDLTAALKKAGDEPRELHLIREGKKTSIRVRAQTRVSLAPAEPENPRYYIGVQTTPVDATLRAHLELPDDSGLVINEVIADSPAAKAGLKPGDILLKLGGQPLPDTETLSQRIQDSEGRAIELEALRGGKRLPMQVTAAPRPESVGSRPAEATLRARLADPHHGLWTRQAMPYVWLNRSQNAPAFRQFMDMPNPSSERLDALAKQVEELRKAVEELNQQLKKPGR